MPMTDSYNVFEKKLNYSEAFSFKNITGTFTSIYHYCSLSYGTLRAKPNTIAWFSRLISREQEL